MSKMPVSNKKLSPFSGNTPPGSNQRPISIFYGLQTRVFIIIFSDNTLSYDQCYEQFNTNIDVGSDIGGICQHQVLLSSIIEEFNKKFKDMNPEEKENR